MNGMVDQTTKEGRAHQPPRVPATARKRGERMSRHVEVVGTALGSMTPDRLVEVARRAAQPIEIDGYPRGGHQGGGSRGVRSIEILGTAGAIDAVPLDSSTEAAVFDRMTDHRRDPVGEAVSKLEDLLVRAARDLIEAERLLEVVLHAADDRRGRESSLQGVCMIEACGRVVTGVGSDRLKRGFCPRCFMAWTRWRLDRDSAPDPGAERRAYLQVRTAQLEAQEEDRARRTFIEPDKLDGLAASGVLPGPKRP